MSQPTPGRGRGHDALAIFLGQWRAEGTSYGGTDPSGDPKANGERWASDHEAHWHTGSFFMIQDERATISGRPFDTLSVMGVDPETGEMVARSFENHGFYRRYELAVDCKVWTLTGRHERARIEFTDGDRTQVISWEWMPEAQWLPLCDRTATRVD